MVATLSARQAPGLDVPKIQALGMLPPPLALQIRKVAARLPIMIETCDAARTFLARIEMRCPELLLIDTDLVGRVDDLCRIAHSGRRDVCVVGLICSWSDREDALRASLDGVLHKPPRAAEWEALARRLDSFRTLATTASRAAPPHLAA